MKKTILFFILLWSVNCKAQDWQNCGDGVLGNPNGQLLPSISCFAVDSVNNILYAGGSFDTINDTTPVFCIAKWDGTTWGAIPALDSISYALYNLLYNSPIYTINSMIMYHGALYLPAAVTYDFGSGNYVTNYYVVKYQGDSVQWLPPLDGEVNCFTIYNDTLYIGGDFVEPDTTVYNHVAKWDGTNWQPVGNGFTLFSDAYAATVFTLGVSDGKLYAGGIFDSTVNVSHLYSIAEWNDTSWIALGRGISSQTDTTQPSYVFAIASYKNNLYVGGQFGFANDDTANCIAEWDGNQWLQLADVVENDVNAFQVYKNKLYVGGDFAIKNFPYSNRIDSWNGTNWASVDSGTTGPVNCLNVFQNNLYVGGEFDSAGNIPANYIAHWSPDSIATAVKQLTINNNQLTIFPNPFSQQTTFQFSQPITNNTQLILYDLTGREVENYTISGGIKNLTIKRNNLPAGMYFYKMQGMPVLTGKVVITEE